MATGDTPAAANITTTEVSPAGFSPAEQAERVLDDLFTFHPPTPEQVEAYQGIRQMARVLAGTIWSLCPPGPDRTAAIRKVREAVMTANASIATHNAAAALR